MTPAAAVPKAKGLNCPNCGGALEMRGFEHTLTIVCPQCLSILDAKDPNLQILQKFKEKTRIPALIPLGSRGEWKGAAYETIGFQQRAVHVDGVTYSWGEYLLFNPYKGFRYLTEYNGHWNDVRTLRALPQPGGWDGKPRFLFEGVSYTHFQSAQAKTTYVLGEFPWRVQRGETVKADDYIAPPLMLSSETTEAETVWSRGEYTSGDEIWRAFKLAGSPPVPSGIFANQPSPHAGRPKELWRICRILLLLTVAAMLATCSFSGDQEVFRQRYSYAPGVPGEASFVTPRFDLNGRPSNVQLSIRTDLNNNWAYFSFALINEGTGQAYDFGREVSYYSGRDSDGSWTEGSSGDTAYIPSVPAGHYYLRVEPEMAPGARAMDYELRLRRDVPRTWYFWLVGFLLLIPPVYASIRQRTYEFQRWQESDYASASSSGDD
ncbi:MAG: DUF4178 domain-containing protein [Candidatus Solibacter usitatus]|nr:DUF4178 domain-containing protein [Candidatus Solibacter usitatus]